MKSRNDLKTIQNLAPGDHLCLLYRTEEEHRAVITPFIRAGLEHNEKVLYITDVRTADTVVNYLDEDGVDVESFIESGQLNILTSDESYMKRGIFDPDSMLVMLDNETSKALDEGFDALRVTGEMCWALRELPGSDLLIVYEAKLNEFFPGKQCLAICQYDMRRFAPGILKQVLQTHPFAIIGSEIYHNHYYLPPEQFLADNREAAELQQWVHNLKERRQTEEESRRLEWLLTRPDSVERSFAPEYGNLTELNTSRLILDSVGPDILRRIMDDFLGLMETSGAIYEKNGDYALGIFSSNWCQLLDGASRKLCDTNDNREALECGRWLCHESCWREAAKVAIETAVEVDIECNGGLHLYAVPIQAGEEIVGAINFGYGDLPRSEERLIEIAGKYGLHVDELRKAAKSYSSRPPYIIELAKRRLHTSAKLIGEIVARKQTELALRESEEKYRTMFENMQTAFAMHQIITDERGEPIDYTFLEVNQAFEQMTGLKKKDIVGRRVTEVLPGTEQEPADWIGNYGRVALEGTVHKFEHLSAALGKWFAGVAYRSAADQFATIFQEITERIQMEKALRQSEERYRLLFNKANDIVFVHYLMGEEDARPFLEVNDAASRILGYSKEELQALTPFDLLADEELDSVPEEAEALLSGGSLLFEKKLLAKNGTRLHVEIHAHIFEYQSETLVLSIARDISERKKAELELIEAREKAEQADRLKSTFLATMSHEIRTPLNAIIGYTDMLLDDEVQCARHIDWLKTVRNSGRLLLRLINDILDFSRIEAYELEVDRNSCSLKSILSEVETIGDMKLRSTEKSVELRKIPPVRIPDLFVGDADRITQVLLNLVTNAIKFTDAGFVEFGASLSDETMLEFYIRDTGRGIPANLHGELFKPFRQIEMPGRLCEGGTGLGLAISKKLVTLMGGTIWFESSTGEGHGSTFRFTIPFEAIESAGTAEITDAVKNEKSVAKIKSGARVLVVEDNEINRILVESLLTGFGFEVVSAENGQEAVEVFQSDPTIVLVLMDKLMPVLDGLEATMRIREFENKQGRSRVPIIALTAAAMKEDRQECLAAGCDDYLTKPIAQRELLDAITRLLGKNTG